MNALISDIDRILEKHSKIGEKCGKKLGALKALELLEQGYKPAEIKKIMMV